MGYRTPRAVTTFEQAKYSLCEKAIYLIILMYISTIHKNTCALSLNHSRSFCRNWYSDRFALPYSPEAVSFPGGNAVNKIVPTSDFTISIIIISSSDIIVVASAIDVIAIIGTVTVAFNIVLSLSLLLSK